MMDGEPIALPDGGVGFKAVYIEQVVPQYQGNPLIEALPVIPTDTELYNSMIRLPEPQSYERQLADHYRLHCILRLDDYFQPAPWHADIAWRVSALIRDGYVGRSAQDPSYARGLLEGAHALRSGQYNVSIQEPTTKASGMTIIGTSGMGKSTTLAHVLKMYPQVIVHSKYKNKDMSLYQITWLKIDCPHNGSIKDLCGRFFEAVDNLIGGTYSKDYGGERKTEYSMTMHMRQVARLHCLGVLVVDEIQHLSVAKSQGRKAILNFLVDLVNSMGVSVIVVGTPKALKYVQDEFREARRGEGVGDISFERCEKESEFWELFTEGLWDCIWLKSENALTKELSTALYDVSQGILGIAVKIFELCQIRLLGKTPEVLTPDLIHKVANDDFKLIQPFIEALRSGDIFDEVFEDIRPVNFQSLINKYEKELEKRNTVAVYRKAANEVKEQTLQEVLKFAVPFLMALKFSQKASEKAVRDAIVSLGHSAPMNEVFTMALESLNVEKPTKGQQTKDMVKEGESQENEKDLRVIVRNGKERRMSAQSVLSEAGYGGDPRRDPLLQLV